MINFVRNERSMTITAPNGGVVSGQVLKVQDTVGVIAGDADAGTDAVLVLEGVFNLPKAAVAFTQGGRVYWDDSAKKVTTTSSSNTLMGVADVDAASGVTASNIRLNGSF